MDDVIATEHSLNVDVTTLWKNYSARERKEVALKRYYLWEVLRERFPMAHKLYVLLEDKNGNTIYEGEIEQVS